MHRAAVYLAKLQATGAKVVGVKPATRAARQPKPAAAPAPVVLPGERIARASATLRFGGVEYRGEGRNLLDALGNAQAAA